MSNFWKDEPVAFSLNVPLMKTTSIKGDIGDVRIYHVSVSEEKILHDYKMYIRLVNLLKAVKRSTPND